MWRFPVKSMQGERLEEATVGERGIEGDRAWAVALVEHGTALSAKRDAVLLRCAATTTNGHVRVELPDGRIVEPPDGAEELTALLGREVEFVSATDGLQARYDLPEDFTTEGVGRSIRYPCPPGTFFDLSALQLLTTASLGPFDVRRFRPNVLVEADSSEESWVGREVEIGEVRASVSMLTPRCVMTTHEQGDLPKDRDVLRTVAREHGNNLGVNASVLSPGRIRVGDTVRVL